MKDMLKRLGANRRWAKTGAATLLLSLGAWYGYAGTMPVNPAARTVQKQLRGQQQAKASTDCVTLYTFNGYFIDCPGSAPVFYPYDPSGPAEPTDSPGGVNPDQPTGGGTPNPGGPRPPYCENCPVDPDTPILD